MVLYMNPRSIAAVLALPFVAFALSACGADEAPATQPVASTPVVAVTNGPDDPTADCWAALPFEDPNGWQQQWNTLATEATIELAIAVLEDLPDPSEGCTAADRAELQKAKDLAADAREGLAVGQS